ncbi:hypothetical protein, partial [Salmonella sp. s54412]|uniref:hypothetical protein n=1 Tax=Salmonella sp. s54412 TaxID=3160128 RepID=UPI00375526DF
KHPVLSPWGHGPDAGSEHLSWQLAVFFTLIVFAHDIPPSLHLHSLQFEPDESNHEVPST